MGGTKRLLESEYEKKQDMVEKAIAKVERLDPVLARSLNRHERLGLGLDEHAMDLVSTLGEMLDGLLQENEKMAEMLEQIAEFLSSPGVGEQDQSARDGYVNNDMIEKIATLLLEIRNNALAEQARMNSERARRAVNARHSKKGGARDKQAKIRAIWASGKYSSRDICAEQECAALDMSYSAARKALRNTPAPS